MSAAAPSLGPLNPRRDYNFLEYSPVFFNGLPIIWAETRGPAGYRGE